jgi:hypothetical protein
MTLPMTLLFTPTASTIVRMSMIREVVDELRSVSGRSGLIDGILPPIVFVAVNTVAGTRPAAAAGVGLAALIVIWRLARRASSKYAFSGLIGTALAVGLALRSGDARDYFLPGIISGAATTALILMTILVRKPFVAWSSWVTRQWPLGWYWHPLVRPAYMITSWLWFVFFLTRTSAQWWLYSTDQTGALGIVRAVTGWPGLVGLIVTTYVVGRRTLERLEGPSVQQFIDGTPPPWTPQERGF